MFHILDLSGTFPSLSLFLSIVLSQLNASYKCLPLDTSGTCLSLLSCLPNIHFLSHICLFASKTKWNLCITCSRLPNMNPSGTCPSLGSKSTWISILCLFLLLAFKYLSLNKCNISQSYLI